MIKKLILIFSLISYNLSSQVFINEVMINAAGANDGSNMPNTAEWIEFYNTSSTPTDISCWVFTDGDFSVTFPLGTSIPANGFFTVASASGSGTTPDLNWATCGCTTGSSTTEVGVFTNVNEQILLYNTSGVIVDAIIWGSGQLPDGMVTNTIGSCTTQTFTFPSAGASYESIGSQSDGITKERDYDGSSTWQNGGSGTFGTSNGVNPMPIELLSFTSNLYNENILINWETLSETNNDYFTIEKSYDLLNFDVIHIKKSIGNSNELIKYSFLYKDNYCGLIYFRLKQTDYNGEFKYSDIVFIDNSNMDIKIFPNPNNGEIDIISSDNFRVEIVDFTGKEIMSGYSKDNKMKLFIKNKGIYLVKLYLNKNVYINKIIVE